VVFAPEPRSATAPSVEIITGLYILFLSFLSLPFQNSILQFRNVFKKKGHVVSCSYIYDEQIQPVTSLSGIIRGGGGGGREDETDPSSCVGLEVRSELN